MPPSVNFSVWPPQRKLCSQVQMLLISSMRRKTQQLVLWEWLQRENSQLWLKCHRREKYKSKPHQAFGGGGLISSYFSWVLQTQGYKSTETEMSKADPKASIQHQEASGACTLGFEMVWKLQFAFTRKTGRRTNTGRWGFTLFRLYSSIPWIFNGDGGQCWA